MKTPADANHTWQKRSLWFLLYLLPIFVVLRLVDASVVERAYAGAPELAMVGRTIFVAPYLISALVAIGRVDEFNRDSIRRLSRSLAWCLCAASFFVMWFYAAAAPLHDEMHVIALTSLALASLACLGIGATSTVSRVEAQ